jgi:hypothetical protein
MCYVYELNIDGEVTGALYEYVSLGRVVFHDWFTDDIKIYENKNVFEKQFYDNETQYTLEEVITLFR